MQTLRFKPFSKEHLVEGIRAKLPHRRITTNFGALQVRTSGFTVTGNIGLRLKPEKGTITTSSGLDTGFILLLFCLPLGIYVLAKRRKIKALEDEVVAALMELLDPPTD
ncbi:hypothetical protein [Parapedobacter sp.]